MWFGVRRAQIGRIDGGSAARSGWRCGRRWKRRLALASGAGMDRSRMGRLGKVGVGPASRHRRGKPKRSSGRGGKPVDQVQLEAGVQERRRRPVGGLIRLRRHSRDREDQREACLLPAPGLPRQSCMCHSFRLHVECKHTLQQANLD
ncbi:hypothetical protein M5K25_024654 [Dendrobium thyrsiflorum]|uniref:Uncharacterized protein n=1 Tax=Dendrobium thyrsiflorum TaxID=117978 RepID=A0ABD0U2J1_DENTH